MLTFLADRGPAKRNAESHSLSTLGAVTDPEPQRISTHNTPLKHTHTTGCLSITEKCIVSDSFFFKLQAKPIPENVSSKCGHYVSVGGVGG